MNLGDLLALPPRIGTTQPATDMGRQICVRVGEIGQDRDVRLDACKFVTLSGRELDIYELRPGDVLLARAIGSEEHLGKFSIMQSTHSQVVFDSHVMRLRLNQDVLNVEFFAVFLASAGGRSRFMQQGRPTAVQFNVNSDQIQDVTVPLPPMSLQYQFAKLAHTYVTVRRQQEEAARQGEHLFATLLARAFAGEL